MIIDPKIQEINIPGCRKLKGGEIIPKNIILKLKNEKSFDEYEKYFKEEKEDKKKKSNNEGSNESIK